MQVNKVITVLVLPLEDNHPSLGPRPKVETLAFLVGRTPGPEGLPYPLGRYTALENYPPGELPPG